MSTLALFAGVTPALYAGANNTIAHMAGGAWIGTSTDSNEEQTLPLFLHFSRRVIGCKHQVREKHRLGRVIYSLEIERAMP